MRPYCFISKENHVFLSRLNHSISKLKQATTIFLSIIVKSRAKLPFGILYMAKVLYHALAKKFPGTPEKDILKVVGNLVYYRYINSAIVAPDAFNIIDVSAESGGLNNEQRRNLGSIAKILQFAATKKGFGDESPHLTLLNPFISECHEKFKKFFLECCSVSLFFKVLIFLTNFLHFHFTILFTGGRARRRVLHGPIFRGNADRKTNHLHIVARAVRHPRFGT